jgi:hypothetical protein
LERQRPLIGAIGWFANRGVRENERFAPTFGSRFPSRGASSERPGTTRPPPSMAQSGERPSTGLLRALSRADLSHRRKISRRSSELAALPPWPTRLPPASTVVFERAGRLGLAEAPANQPPPPWPRPFGRQRVEPFRPSSASLKTSAPTGVRSPYVTPPAAWAYCGSAASAPHCAPFDARIVCATRG